MKIFFPIIIASYTIFIVLIILLKKKEKPWSEMNDKDKRIRIIFILIGLLFLVSGIIAFFLYNK